MIFDFKFGSNRTAGSEDTIIFVAAHGPHRTIPLLVVSDFRVSYVTYLERPVAFQILGIGLLQSGRSGAGVVLRRKLIECRPVGTR